MAYAFWVFSGLRIEDIEKCQALASKKRNKCKRPAVVEVISELNLLSIVTPSFGHIPFLYLLRPFCIKS
jgi:hypothetical protein